MSVNTNNIRFLFLTCGYPPEKNAGAENAIQRMGAALVARGHSVTVVTIYHDRNLPDEETKGDGVRIVRALRPLALGPLWGITFRRQVKQVLTRKDIEWDIVICNSLFLYSDLATEAAMKTDRYSAHRIMNAHGFSDFNLLKAERGGEKILAKVRRDSNLLVLSRQSAREAASFGFAESQIRFWRNFIDDPGLPTLQAHESKVFLYMGRFSEQKNVELLLRSFLQYCEEGGKYSLKLVGHGDKKEGLLKNLQSSNHSHRVSLYPWSDDPAEHYRDCRAVVSASRAEGMSNVMVEALAHGRPILWTDVSGVQDAIHDSDKLSISPGVAVKGDGGWIVPLDEQKALVDGLHKMENDDSVQEQSMKARTQYERKYHESVAVETFLSEVSEIMKPAEEN